MRILTLLTAVFFSTAAIASNDAMAPKSSKKDALTSPLHTVTIATNNLEESLLFYRDGWGLTVEGPIAMDDTAKVWQRAMWNIADDVEWDTYILTRPGIDNPMQIRLLVMKTPQKAAHDSWNSMEYGGFSVGFPNMDQVAQDKKLRQLGFGAMNEIEIYPVPRPDGTSYMIYETIHNGPDFVHAVGIHRGDGNGTAGPH